MVKKRFKIGLAVGRHNTGVRRTDRRTDTARRQRPRCAERRASKTGHFYSYLWFLLIDFNYFFSPLQPKTTSARNWNKI